MEFITALVSIIISVLFIVYGCFFDKWTAGSDPVPAAGVAKDVKVKEDDWSNKYKVKEEGKKSALQKFDAPIQLEQKVDSAANYDPNQPI